jgi:hypothetical protein
LRNGFGGKRTVMMKPVYASMSAAESGAPVPMRLTNAGLKAWKLGRSPRQWNGSRLSSPRSVWVAIGPFMGSKPFVEGPSGAKWFADV